MKVYARCGALNRQGNPCAKSAGWGTNHQGVGRCRLHGGNTPNHRTNAETVLARQACLTLGLQIDTTPADALLQEVREAAGNVAYYRALVQDLPAHPEPDEYDPEADRWTRGQPGIYGRTYHQSGLPTGEAKPHVLVQLYNDERRHLANVTVSALKVGIAERAVRLAEQQAALVADCLRAFAIQLGHDPAEPIVREAFRAQLTVLTGGQAS